MKKLVAILVLSLVCTLCAVGLAACDNADGRNEQILSIYNTYAAYAEENGVTPLSYDEWLKSIKGKDGKDGANGIDGINGKDGVSIVKIEKTSTEGLVDTYTITYSDGNTFEFTVTNGEQGAKGERGEKGEKGDKGAEIKKAEINDKGELIITLTDESTVNAGVVKIVHPHEIVEKEIIDKEPTCHSAGISYIICDTCKEILRTVAIEKTPHPFADEIVAPTCTESGYTMHTCTVCGYKTTDSFVEPTGHSYKREYVFDDVCHWQETICGHADAIVKVLHTLDDNGICTVCGYDNNVTLALKYVPINDGKEYAVDELDNDQVKVVYIPETYNGKPVTKINEMVFYGNTNLEKVVIGDNVTDIGASAFYNCSNLKLIKLPENLSEIKASAFYNCYNLTEIIIPDNVTSIGDRAFYRCNNLVEIIIPDGVTSMGNSAFSNCTSLTSVTIGNGVTSLGDSAFDNCSSLTSITIPDSVTSIGSGAFYGCPCKKTTKGLSYVDKWLINADTAITSVNIKDDTVGIADYAFSGCNGLTNITIPDSVTSIGNSAFSNCSGLTSVTISNGIASIGSSAFSGCSNLTSIYYTGTPSEWAQIDGLGNLMSSSRTLYINNETLTSVVLENITEIKPYAFYYCISLTSVTIGNGVTSIGSSVFNNCSRLSSVTIGNGVTSIGNYAFYNCYTKIYYNGSAEDWEKISIGDYNYYLTSDRRYYYSETEPELNESGTAYNGKYWHYDADGITPVIWVKEN